MFLRNFRHSEIGPQMERCKEFCMGMNNFGLNCTCLSYLSSVNTSRSEDHTEVRLKSTVRIRRLNREMKAAKHIGLMIGTFVVLWTPFMLVVMLASFEVPISMDTITIVKCLHYANSAVNPILYAVLNRAFRKAARGVMRNLGFI